MVQTLPRLNIIYMHEVFRQAGRRRTKGLLARILSALFPSAPSPFSRHYNTLLNSSCAHRCFLTKRRLGILGRSRLFHMIMTLRKARQALAGWNKRTQSPMGIRQWFIQCVIEANATRNIWGGGGGGPGSCSSGKYDYL